MGWIENVACWLLTDLVGEYVENLRPEQLELSLRRGDVRAADLAVRSDAVGRALRWPAVVRRGVVRSLHLVVPWARLASERVVLDIDGVFAVAGPRAAAEAASDSSADRHAEKMAALAQYELAASSAGGDEKEKGGGGGGAFSRMLATAAANVVVSIRNVHLRYEDVDAAGTPWALGITLRELSLTNADANWAPAAQQEQQATGGSAPLFKLARLDGLGVYWDHSGSGSGAIPVPVNDAACFYSEMERLVSADETLHSFVLKPISATLRLTLNNNRADRSQPRYRCSAELDDLALGLEQRQYHQLLEFLSVLYNFYRNLRAQQRTAVSRPTGSVKSCAKEWWKYATASVLETVRARRFHLSAEYFSKRHAYIAAYVRKLQEDSSQKEGDAATMDEVERAFSLDDLLLLRSIAVLQLKLDRRSREAIAAKRASEAKQQQQQQQQQKQGWLSWMYTAVVGTGKSAPEDGAASASSSTTTISAAKALISAEDRQEFARFLKWAQEEEDECDGKPSAQHEAEGLSSGDSQQQLLLVSASILLRKGSIALKRASGTVCVASFSAATAGFDMDLSKDHWATRASLGDLRVVDAMSEHLDRFPWVLSLDPSASQGDAEAFVGTVESHPRGSNADFAVSLRLMPVRMVVLGKTLRRVASFFTVPSRINVDYLREDVSDYIAELSAKQVRHALESKLAVLFDVAVEEAEVVVPFTSPLPNSCVVVRPGRFTLRTAQPEEEPLTEQQKMYDRFEAVLASIRAEVRGDGGVTAPFVEPFTFSVIVEKCKLPPNVRWPQLIVTSHMDSVVVFVSDDIVNSVVASWRSSPIFNAAKLFTPEDEPVISAAPCPAVAVGGAAPALSAAAVSNMLALETAAQDRLLYIELHFNLEAVGVTFVLNEEALCHLTAKTCTATFVSDSVSSTTEIALSSLVVDNPLRAQDHLVESAEDGELFSLQLVSPSDGGASTLSVAGGNLFIAADIPLVCSILRLLHIGTDGETAEDTATPEHTVMAIDVNFAGAKALLFFPEEEDPFCALEVNALESHIDVRRRTFRAEGMLEGLRVQDLTHKTADAFRDVLLPGSGTLAFFQFATHNDVEPGYPGFDTELRVEVGGVKATFLMRFFTTILKWMVLLNTSRPHPPDAKISETSGRFKYFVHAANPVLVLPRGSASAERFTLALGDVSIENAFLDDNGLERIRMLLPTVEANDWDNAHVATLSDVALDFEFPLPTTKLVLPNNGIHALISQLDAQLGQAQYNSLYAAVSENFGDSVPISEPRTTQNTSLFTVDITQSCKVALLGDKGDPFVLAAFNQISWRMTLEPGKTWHRASLRGADVLDLTPQYRDGPCRTLFSSNRAHSTAVSDLLSLTQTMLSSPAAGGAVVTDQSIDVEFGEALLNTNRETLEMLIRFVIPNERESCESDSVGSSMAPVRYTFTANMRKLCVSLIALEGATGVPFSDILLENAACSTRWGFLGNEVEVAGKMRNLSVVDIRRRMVVAQFPACDDVLDFKVRYSSGVSAAIEARGNAPLLRYDPEFVKLMSAYASTLSAASKTITTEASKAIQESAIPPLLTLNVDFGAPQIELQDPKNAGVKVVLDFGRLRVMTVPAIEPEVKYIGDLLDMRVRFGDRDILEKTCLHAEVSRNPLFILSSVESVDISASKSEYSGICELVQRLFGGEDGAVPLRQTQSPEHALEPSTSASASDSATASTLSGIDFHATLRINQLKLHGIGVFLGSARGIDFSVIQAGRGVTCLASMDSLHLKDNRADRSVFENIISTPTPHEFRRGAKAKPIVSLAVNYRPAPETPGTKPTLSVNTRLRKPTVVIVPAALLSAASFFAVSGAPKDKESSVSAVSAASAMESVDMEVRARFDMEVDIPEDLLAETSRMMVFEVSASAHARRCKQELQGSAQVKELRLFTCVAGQRLASQLAVVERCSLSSQFSIKPDLMALAIFINNPVFVTASVNDIKLVAFTLAALFPQIAQNASQDPKKRRQIHPETSLYQITPVLPLEAASSSPSPQASPSSSSEGPALVAVFDVNRISVSLLNDIDGQNTPVISAALGIRCEIALPDPESRKSRASLGVNIESSVYNPEVSSWQPFTEPWSATITAGPPESPEEGEEVRVSTNPLHLSHAELTSTTPFNVTLTPACVNSLLGFVDTLSSEYSAFLSTDGKGKVQRKPFVPFIIRNRTGSDLGFEVPGLSRGIVLDEDEAQLGSGSARDLPGTGGAPVLCKFRVADVVAEWPINKVCTMRRGPLVMDVILGPNGCKIATLRSKITLRNASMHALDFLLLLPTGASTVLEKVAPGSQAFVPVLTAQTEFKLALRDASEPAGTFWSEFFFGPCILKPRVSSRSTRGRTWYSVHASHRVRTAFGQYIDADEEDDEYAAAAAAAAEYDSASAHEMLGVLITIKPPLLVSNHLPVPISFKMECGASGHVLPAGKFGVHIVDTAADDVVMDLLVHGHVPTSWAESLLVHTAASRPQVKRRASHASFKFGERKALRVHVETKVSRSDNTVRIVVSSKYIIQNRIGEPVFLSTGTSGGAEMPLSESTQPFPLNTEDKLAIRCSSTTYSEAFSLDKLSAGADASQLLWIAGNPSRELVVTLKKHTVANKLFLKKVVVSPRFVIENGTPFQIRCASPGSASAPITTVAPHSAVPFHRNTEAEFPILKVMLEGFKWSELPISCVDKFPLRVHAAAGEDVLFVDVEIMLQGATTVVRLKVASGEPAFVFVNFLPVPIRAKQLGTFYTYVIPPLHSSPFAWDAPASKRSAEIAFKQVDINHIGRLPVFPIADLGNAYIEIEARGPTRIVKICPEIDQRRSGRGARVVNNVSDFALKISMPAGVGLSLVNSTPEEVLYISASGLSFEYKREPRVHSLRLQLSRLQVDSQSRLAVVPVLLHPEDEAAAGPFLLIALRLHRSSEAASSDMIYLHQLAVQIAPLDLRLEEAVLDLISGLAGLSFKASRKQHQQDLALSATFDAREQPSESQVFVEELLVNPIDLNISFIKSPNYRHSREFTNLVWRWFGAMLKLDDAHILLAELITRDVGGSIGTVGGLIGAHYSSQVSKQLAKILFSSNVVGNPIGLFRDIRTGVESFRERPDAHGLGQLVAHTAAGVSGSTGALTGFASSQLRAISGDESYARATKPSGFRDGARKGIRALGEGLFRGVTGIVTAPISRIKTDGAKGIVPGLLHGVVGIFAQPVSGALEAVSDVSSGFHSHVVGFKAVGRQRLPRYIRPDGTLEAYNEELALQQQILQQIHSNLRLLDCVVLRPEGMPSRALLLSSVCSLFCVEHGQGVSARVLWRKGPADVAANGTSALFVLLDSKEWRPPSESERAFRFLEHAVQLARSHIQQLL